jgi:hypothetical protein
MVPQQVAYGAFGNADEDAIEHLQDIGEGGAVTVVLRNKKMRGLVEDEKSIKAALLDQDAVAFDIGIAADLGIGETGDEFESRERTPARGKDGDDQGSRLGGVHDAMTVAILREEVVLETAQRRAIVTTVVARRCRGRDGFPKRDIRLTPEPHLHEPTDTELRSRRRVWGFMLKAHRPERSSTA